MQLVAVFKALLYMVFVLLCLTILSAVPCSCSLICLNNSSNQDLLRHPARLYINENDSSAVVAATKAYLSPVVFRGTLLSVLVQMDGTVLATFRVDQTMKVDLGSGRSLDNGQQMEVVYLRRAGESCALEVNEGNLKFGTSYIVFGQPRNGAMTSVVATEYPIPYERKTFRAIRRVVCKGCAKPPRIEGLKSVRILEKRKLRLQCHVSGNPVPWVSWYKDGQLIEGKGRVKVRTKRRTSRLTIRQTRVRDRGVYECRAVNIVRRRPSTARAAVTVLRKKTTKKPTPTASSLWPVISCPNSDFCLNGGTCFFYKDVREYVCHCADGFMGHRCDFKDVQASVGGVKKYSSRGAIP